MKFAEPSKLNRNPGGWGTRLFVVLPAVPNTNRGLIENFFLLRKPHEACQRHQAGQQIRGKRSGGVVHIAALCRRFLEWRRLVSSGVFDHLVFSTSTVAMGSSAFAGN
jgi:hypothetical protein